MGMNVKCLLIWLLGVSVGKAHAFMGWRRLYLLLRLNFRAEREVCVDLT